MPLPKVLSQAGVSLADVYDVEGSIAGVDSLDVTEVKAVHSLGPQIHSERLQVFNLVANTGGVLQNTNFETLFDIFPDSINRLLSALVVADTAARTDFCSIAIRDPQDNRDHLIWVWDDNDDISAQARFRVSGGAVATFEALRPIVGVPGGLPTIIGRTGLVSTMPTLVFGGRTTGFGAGTVTLRGLLQVARPNTIAPLPGEPSSHGLPIPGW